MKRLLLALPLLALAGCAEYFPMTHAGFQANGIVGAVDGFTGGVVALCETADGEQFTVASNALADEFGASNTVDSIREFRQGLCAKAGAVHVVAGLGAG